MGDVVFYGAVSLDGYLARENQALDWLFEAEKDAEDIGYEAFYATIDTVVMGRVTYDEVVRGGRAWPYAGKPSYVFSRTNRQGNQEVTFVQEDPTAFVRDLKQRAPGRIWVVGGGLLLAPLIAEGLIDEYIVQVVPRIIGQGIPLFHRIATETVLELTDVRRMGQFAELRYRTREVRGLPM
ncbi:dihydrofolate reductase family protein [Sulfobacillus harzensis]|uniref:Dihydrofolate reductase n=1 Tax=Sulfobacillus harzensis TaxID=2729629 RepID=A0A7Y0Q2Q6_9FIRM|nr:dihydrofolate reductase family protein [Sulfobacillus harzensis]NMP22787.1 dihydrofolate reductase [Sulfobacillus harzensis]